RAEAALECVLLVEGLLHRVERVPVGEALDRGHLVPVDLDGEQRARLDRLAVEQDGAGAAGRRVAPDVGAGQAKLLAEEVDEELPRLDLGLVSSAVDGDRDLPHVRSPPGVDAENNASSV